jgi:hypothetical protein
VSVNRTGQILLEVLVAAILLVVLIPHIPALCSKYAGPDRAAYSAMVAENNAQIYLNEQKAKLADVRAQLAAMAAAKAKRSHDAVIAEEQLEHREAVKLLDRFSERQDAILAKCVKEAKGKLSEPRKDQMIFNIWLASSDECTCQELSVDSSVQLSRVAHLNQ